MPLQLRGTYSIFRSASAVKRPLPPCFFAPPFPETSAPLRLVFFRRGAELTAIRVRCQPTSSTRYFPLFSSAPLRLTASRGCGFYHHRVPCQPGFVDHLFHLSVPDRSPHRRCGFVFPFEGRAFYFSVASGVNSHLLPLIPLSSTRHRRQRSPYLGVSPALVNQMCRRSLAPIHTEATWLAAPLAQRPVSGVTGRSSRSLERSTRPRRQRSAVTTARSSWKARSMSSFTMM